MSRRFTWKAEIEFEGTAEELNAIAPLLNTKALRVSFPWEPHGPPGFVGPIERVPGLAKLAQAGARETIAFPGGIAGGIREAHLHVDKDVVFLNAAQFKDFAALVAGELAGKRAEQVKDFVSVMKPITRLGETE